MRRTWFQITSLLILYVLFNSTLPAQLSGTYTVGGASPDYATPALAAAAVDNLGINGPVIFEIRNGVYTSPIVISTVLGSNATNTILFRSESGDSSQVEIMNNSGKAVDISYCNHISFHQLTFSSTWTATVTQVFHSLSSSQISITNCVLNGVPNSISNQNYNLFLQRGTDFEVRNNWSKQGGKGIAIEGGTSNPTTQNVNIIGNRVDSTTYQGIQVFRCGFGLRILDNEVYGVDNYQSQGIWTTLVTDSLTIMNNKIISGAGGIRVSGNWNAFTPGLVANNMISCFATIGQIRAIEIANTDSLHLVHNSVYLIDSSSLACHAFWYSNNNPGTRILNNSFVCENCDEPAVVSGGGFTYGIFEYNNFFTDSTFSFVLPPNSYSEDPGYFSFEDLHTLTNVLDGKGTPVANVTTDIDGETRNGATPDIGADEFIPLNNNAGTELTLPAVCGSGQNASVTLKNWGGNPITSAQLNWRLNGVLQTPVNWAGNLFPGQSAFVSLGVVPSGGVQLEIWSSLPNGVPDPYPVNDTSQLDNVFPGLSGTYTIGGTTPDFTSLGAAVTAIELGGLCGPTTLSIRDGSYRESLLIDYIPSSSPTHTLTFQGESGDSSLVEIWQDYPDPTAWIIRCHSIKNIVFRDLKLRNYGTINNDVFQWFNGENLLVEHCEIQGRSGATSSGTDDIMVIGFMDSNVVVRNNFIWGGDKGVNVTGFQNPVRPTGIVIEGNTILAGSRGILFSYTSGLKILGNNIQGGGYGILGENSNGAWEIIGNRFIFSNRPVQLNGCHGYPGRAKFVNNSIRISQGNPIAAPGYGMWLVNCEDLDLWFNTIEFTTTGTYQDHHCMYLDRCDSATVYNNNFLKLGPGKVVRYFNSTGMKSDYNNFYAPVADIQYNIPNLAQWQATTGLDSHSVSVDPIFNGATIDSMLPSHSLVAYGGIPIPGVTEDINGNTRNLTNPWIGSQEAVQAPQVYLGLDTIVCDSIELDGGNPGSTYLWSNGATTRRIQVSQNGTYWVQATNGLGSNSDTLLVTIATAPILQLPLQLTLCAGDSILLDPMASAGNYIWSTGDSTPTIYAATGGTFVLTAANAGCVSSDTTLILSLPQPVLTPLVDYGICPGDSAQLDAGQIPGQTYLWSTADTLAQIQVFTSGLYSVITANSCGSLRDSMQLTVFPSPTIQLSGTDSICEGDSTTLSATGGQAYQWSTGNTQPSIGISPANSGFISVTVTDSNQCEGEDSLWIEVHSLPMVLITGQDTLCTGDSVSLMAVGGNTYQWSTGDTLPSISLSPIVSSWLSLIGTDANGCTGADSLWIEVHPLPTILITGQDTICAGDSVALMVAGGNTYQWSTGETLPSISISPLTSGWISVIGTDVNGCSNADSAWVEVHPLPTLPQITQSGSQLIASSAFSYQWLDTLGALSGETDSIFVPTQSGSYRVEIMDSNGCSAVSSPYAFIFTHRTSPSSQVIKLYPNPNAGNFKVRFETPLQEKLVYQLLSPLGQTVNTGTVLPGNTEFHWDFSHLPQGVYHFRLSGKTIHFYSDLILLPINN